MALPDLIEIVPLDKPVRAEITVPGSKSITNRALILAALADGEVTLEGALWSEDTQIMVECLQELGFVVNVATDPDEFCNRTITVIGRRRQDSATAARRQSRWNCSSAMRARRRGFSRRSSVWAMAFIGCTACRGCTNVRRRRCFRRCANWAIASNRKMGMTNCRREFLRAQRDECRNRRLNLRAEICAVAAKEMHASASRKVRSSRRRCCCARRLAAGKLKSSARTRRNRRMWR